MYYLVTTIRTPRFDASVVPEHYEFLDQLRKAGRLVLAGPFTDKSGGAYLLKAGGLEEAKALAFEDPVYRTRSSNVEVREWNAS